MEGTVINTLIHGLSQQMVQARLNTADAKPFLFGTHFPVKKVNGFNWRTLENQVGRAHVAADLHADNGTIVRKHRPLFASAKGDIPFIAISREMKRSELKEYQTALAFAQDSDATALVEYWGNIVYWVHTFLLYSALGFYFGRVWSKCNHLQFTASKRKAAARGLTAARRCGCRSD